MNTWFEQESFLTDDDYINDLASDWYFLSLHFNSAGTALSDTFANELIKLGIQLKKHLSQGGHTYLEPMNVCVDTQTFFDVWMDADGDIQVSELYTNAD